MLSPIPSWLSCSNSRASSFACSMPASEVCKRTRFLTLITRCLANLPPLPRSLTHPLSLSSTHMLPPSRLPSLAHPLACSLKQLLTQTSQLLQLASKTRAGTACENLTPNSIGHANDIMQPQLSARNSASGACQRTKGVKLPLRLHVAALPRTQS